MTSRKDIKNRVICDYFYLWRWYTTFLDICKFIGVDVWLNVCLRFMLMQFVFEDKHHEVSASYPERVDTSFQKFLILAGN
jgi:hypothetical protein